MYRLQGNTGIQGYRATLALAGIKPVQGGVMTASHSVPQPVSGQRLPEMQNLPRLSRTGKGRPGAQMPTLFRHLLVRDVLVKFSDRSSMSLALILRSGHIPGHWSGFSAMMQTRSLLLNKGFA
jgi:hypothetical protein